METYTSTRLAFAETGAVRSFAEFSKVEAYEGLVRKYEEWVASATDK